MNIINMSVSVYSYVDVNVCNSFPCQYGAECVDFPSGYSCNCLQGFTGGNCGSGMRTTDA